MLEYLQGVGFFLPFLFVIAIVIFFHELGHFLVARWCGVTVRTFSLGFGPELFGFNDRYGTRWKLCAIPLGGYVRFLGDEDESLTGEDGRPLAEEERRGAFHTKTLAQKAAVVAAGPVANFILAIVILTAIFTIYGRVITSAVVNEVVADSPAAAAGLMPGDVIVSVNGSPIGSFNDLQRIISVSADQPLQLGVERGETALSLNAVPQLQETTDAFGNTMRVGVLGIRRSLTADDYVTERYSLPQAVGIAVGETWFIVDQTFAFFGRLFTGRDSLEQLSGPIAIAEMSGQVAAYAGISGLLNFAAFVSISVGLFNLFPIPILDGGRLLFYGVEALTGRPLSPRFQDLALRIGLVLILALVVIVIRNDVT